MIGGFEIMAQKVKLKDIGMDSMEILYYERQAKRKKAYAAKKRKTTKIKERPGKRIQRKQETEVFDSPLKKAI